ncbi:uncharacterized protein C10orf67 homolog, mitochondrial [Gastrophryne carolinensis]
MESGGIEDDDRAVAEYVRELELSHMISAQLRLGNFESDHATQTDITEVWELKELRNVIQTLTQALDTLRKEVVFQKNLLQAEHEQKIQAQATELHHRMNERLSDIEAVHKKKISTLRKSFQQQLADALAVIKSSYENYYNGISGAPQSHAETAANIAKLQTLQRMLDEKDLLIQSLEAQLLQSVDNEQPKQIIYESENDPEKERLLEENKEMRSDMDTLQDRVHQLETALKKKDKLIQSLDQDVGTMKVRMEEDQRTIEKLSLAQEQLKSELEKEKSASAASVSRSVLQESYSMVSGASQTIKNIPFLLPLVLEMFSRKGHNVTHILDECEGLSRFWGNVRKIVQALTDMDLGEDPLQQQREEMENVLKSKLKEREEEQAQLQQEHDAKVFAEVQRTKQQLMSEAEEVQKMKAEAEQLKRMKEKPKTPKLDFESMGTEKEKLQTQIKKLLTVREEDLRTIDRLQRELDRLNKTWEKKFEILKQSFHAIKDEMFLRQSLHRQAMSLPRVSVSYMTDGTLPNELPERNNFYLPSLPLPQIGAKVTSTMPMMGISDHCQDTSQHFYKDDELQVVSDTEDDFEGVPPLPPPPADLMKDNDGRRS